VTIAIGGTAARSLLGRAVTVGQERTAHRDARLRAGLTSSRATFSGSLKDRDEDKFARIVKDLRRAASHP